MWTLCGRGEAYRPQEEREKEWKLLGREGSTTMSLHRLSGDDPEKADLSAEHPEIVQRLRALHEAWAEDVCPK